MRLFGMDNVLLWPVYNTCFIVFIISESGGFGQPRGSFREHKTRKMLQNA